MIVVMQAAKAEAYREGMVMAMMKMMVKLILKEKVVTVVKEMSRKSIGTEAGLKAVLLIATAKKLTLLESMTLDSCSRLRLRSQTMGTRFDQLLVMH